MGRLTPYCVQEINNWINKVFGYEKNPNLAHNTALWFYKDMQIGDAPSVFPEHFTHYYIEMNNAQEAVEYYLSYGYGIDNIHCHGLRDTFSDISLTIIVAAYWPYNPSQFADGLNNLANFDKYYFVYSLVCHNGAMIHIGLILVLKMNNLPPTPALPMHLQTPTQMTLVPVHFSVIQGHLG